MADFYSSDIWWGSSDESLPPMSPRSVIDTPANTPRSPCPKFVVSFQNLPKRVPQKPETCVPQFIAPPTIEETILNNLVLAKVYQYLPHSEVARGASVCRHWNLISKNAFSITNASVDDSAENYVKALRWLASRTGLRSLNLDVDTRKCKRDDVITTIEVILSILNGHSKTLRQLSFYVPVDRFMLAHSQTELMRLYSSLQGDEETENDCVILPNVDTFHFRQKWNSWKFCLPKLRHLSVSIARMIQGVDFDKSSLESIDLGASDATSCIQVLEQCINLRTVVINVNEFRVAEMREVWGTLMKLKHLRHLWLLHFDDFEINSNEIFADAKLFNPNTEIFYALLDPTFQYEFDASMIALSNPIHIFGDNFATNPPKNVHIYYDPSLIDFRDALNSCGVYCPNVARDIADVDDQILEMSDFVTLQLGN